MAKGIVKEKEILAHIQKEGFREIKAEEKLAKWYKKASAKPSCLRAVRKEKIRH